MAGPHLFAFIPRAARHIRGRGSAPAGLGYNRRMTNPTTHTTTPPALIADLPGLSTTDTARITRAIAATYAPNTLSAYGWAWRHFTTLCAGRDLDPLPATPAAASTRCRRPRPRCART